MRAERLGPCAILIRDSASGRSGGCSQTPMAKPETGWQDMHSTEHLPIYGRRDVINIISAIISGLVIGVLARFFYPGDVDLGWIATILLGIGGSVLASLVASRGSKEFSQPGCLASVIGAVVLIFLGRMFF